MVAAVAPLAAVNQLLVPVLGDHTKRKKKVLFVCIHNSARSVMAEAFVNHLCDDHNEAQSAGIEPGTLNPMVKEVMQEIGIDVSGHQPQAVFDVIKSGQCSPT